MRCEYDNDLTLWGLSQLHRDILLGDTAGQEADIEVLVQLVRYFARRSSRSTLVEELENLQRAADILTAGGEIRSCVFSCRAETLPDRDVPRFSMFDACVAALIQGGRRGQTDFQVLYDEGQGKLVVRSSGD